MKIDWLTAPFFSSTIPTSVFEERIQTQLSSEDCWGFETAQGLWCDTFQSISHILKSNEFIWFEGGINWHKWVPYSSVLFKHVKSLHSSPSCTGWVRCLRCLHLARTNSPSETLEDHGNTLHRWHVGVISEFPMVRICILKSIVKWECMWHKFKAPSFDSSQVLFTHQASSQSHGLSCRTAGLFLMWERHEEVAFCVEQGGQPPDHTWRNKPERPRGLEALNRGVSPYNGIAAMCIWNHMSYVSCACHAAVMNDSMSMADTLYRQHCEALSCLGGTRHFRRCWASYFHSAKKCQRVQVGELLLWYYCYCLNRKCKSSVNRRLLPFPSQKKRFCHLK